MVILGIDPAKVTGWAVYQPGRAGIRDCGTIKTDVKIDGGVAADLSHRLAEVVREYRPDLCVMEAPLYPGLSKTVGKDLFGQAEKIRMTNMRNTLTIYGIRMCYLATLHSLKVPTFEVAIQTWRKGYFGEGVKPPAGQGRQWWKQKAVEQAGQFKFPVDNDDEAEAVGIALWAEAHARRGAALGRQLAGPEYRGNADAKGSNRS